MIVDTSALLAILLREAASARRAWRRFGKCNHPAALEIGDCFAYALAETAGQRLLCKGEDFGRTDITSALSAEAT